jgi:hypothetical protein
MRQVGYGISLGKRWLVEKTFGYLKQTGLLHKIREPAGWELVGGGGTSCFVIR